MKVVFAPWLFVCLNCYSDTICKAGDRGAHCEAHYATGPGVFMSSNGYAGLLDKTRYSAVEPTNNIEPAP
jgi:hypothetical protein